VVLRPKLQAIQCRYIEHNRATRKHWIVVDVDRPGAGHDWQLLEAPAPNIVAENRDNLHAHLFYGLAVPVHTDPDGHLKPLRFAAAVEQALVQKLSGDFGYANYLAKNPLCAYWEVRTYQQYLYDLPWLSDYVDLEPYLDRRRRLPDYGLGRNCTLFGRLRLWAYRARLTTDWPSADAWHVAVLQQAAQFNDFAVPLPFAEVKATAKSVARWTWQRFNYASFSEVQRRRCCRMHALQHARIERKRQLILGFSGLLSVRQLASATGIPRSTVHRLQRVQKSSRSDMAYGTLGVGR
jgi:hypothetical protein